MPSGFICHNPQDYARNESKTELRRIQKYDSNGKNTHILAEISHGGVFLKEIFPQEV